MDDDTKNSSPDEAPAASAEERRIPSAAPAPRVPRAVSDKDVFFQLLPWLAGSFATKSNDPKTVMALAIELAREETGRLADVGACRRTTLCHDERPLALQVYFQPQEVRTTQQPVAPAPVPAGSTFHPHEALPLANSNGRGSQGQMVAHWPTASVQKIQGL